MKHSSTFSHSQFIIHHSKIWHKKTAINSLFLGFFDDTLNPLLETLSTYVWHLTGFLGSDAPKKWWDTPPKTNMEPFGIGDLRTWKWSCSGSILVFYFLEAATSRNILRLVWNRNGKFTQVTGSGGLRVLSTNNFIYTYSATYVYLTFYMFPATGSQWTPPIGMVCHCLLCHFGKHQLNSQKFSPRDLNQTAMCLFRCSSDLLTTAFSFQ